MTEWSSSSIKIMHRGLMNARVWGLVNPVEWWVLRVRTATAFLFTSSNDLTKPYQNAHYWGLVYTLFIAFWRHPSERRETVTTELPIVIMSSLSTGCWRKWLRRLQSGTECLNIANFSICCASTRSFKLTIISWIWKKALRTGFKKEEKKEVMCKESMYSL